MWHCNPEALTQVRAPSGDEVGRVLLESLQYDTPEAEYIKGIAQKPKGGSLAMLESLAFWSTSQKFNHWATPAHVFDFWNFSNLYNKSKQMEIKNRWTSL